MRADETLFTYDSRAVYHNVDVAKLLSNRFDSLVDRVTGTHVAFDVRYVGCLLAWSVHSVETSYFRALSDGQHCRCLTNAARAASDDHNLKESANCYLLGRATF
jgi:hypothetical protein